jgi:hypothetical protein
MTVKDQDPKALRKLIAARLKLGTPVFLEKNGPGTIRCRVMGVAYLGKKVLVHLNAGWYTLQPNDWVTGLVN